jgi:hypothetical protein
MRIAFEIGAGKLERNWRNVGAGGRVCWSLSLKKQRQDENFVRIDSSDGLFWTGLWSCRGWRSSQRVYAVEIFKHFAEKTTLSDVSTADTLLLHIVCVLMRLKLIITNHYQNYIKAPIKYTTHEIAMCLNSHSLSNWHSRITRQLSYKRTFSQNLVSTKNFFPVYDLKNMTCLGLKVD